MSNQEVILRFDEVSFGHGPQKLILNEVDFSVRRGSKITLMGQNGAGKSTIFHLITGALEPDSGAVHLGPGLTVAAAKQVIPRELLHLTVREFFESCFQEKIYDIDPKIDEVLEVVNLSADHERLIKSFSGGQQARLLLASAIIQKPDLLLLDEPTNNLDKEGILHLTQFLIDYQKTCIVISHDADFLNTFTQGVLYLDVFTRQVEQYTGNYFDLLKEITARIEREEAKVDVRKEDKIIRHFTVPCQEDIGGAILNITSFSVMEKHKFVKKETNISLRKKERLLLVGPNGIGKTTLLESLASGKAKGAKIAPGVRVGYYRQDFSTLNFDDTVWQSLSSVAEGLSEGQKGLLLLARIVLQKPGLLILDEPTNHINFRHLPVIAQALDKYEGCMVLVSHMPEFVAKIRIDEVLDLGK